MVAPTNATRSLEEIASATTGPLWFQLYLYPTREIAAELVKRAEDAGYRALVLTVDRPVRSKRERDLRHDFFMPPPSVVKANFTGTTGETHLALTWQDVTWLRDLTSLPVLVKGVLTAEDALLALAHGAAGIIVSNHGGRQLDGTVTALEALPEIVAAISGRCEVYMDGGIRRGTDILKALALGAQAVLVGRPALWGLAVDGAQGVERVLNILRDELLMAMQLAGCPTLADITPSLVRWH
jgi:4-hydroxymandelate oxidase